MFVLYDPNTKNPRRYWNDYKLDDEEKYDKIKPKQCKFADLRDCKTKDPISGVEIPLLYLADDIYICQNCKNKEKIDNWFTNLQQTEIPTTLPALRTMKGRICGDTRTFWSSKISTELPVSNDPCWQFYSILADY